MIKPRQHPTPSAESLQELLPDVTPLPRLNRVPLAKAQPAPSAMQHLRNEREVLIESLSDSDAWKPASKRAMN